MIAQTRIISDIITSKLYKEPKEVERRKIDPSNTVKLTFLNKGFEFINLSKLLHTPTLSKEGLFHESKWLIRQYL